MTHYKILYHNQIYWIKPVLSENSDSKEHELREMMWPTWASKLSAGLSAGSVFPGHSWKRKHLRERVERHTFAPKRTKCKSVRWWEVLPKRAAEKFPLTALKSRRSLSSLSVPAVLILMPGSLILPQYTHIDSVTLQPCAREDATMSFWKTYPKLCSMANCA